jgi:hypothetical protein
LGHFTQYLHNNPELEKITMNKKKSSRFAKKMGNSTHAEPQRD